MSPIPKRHLGRNGPLVNRLGFGLMGLSGIYDIPKPDSVRLALLDSVYEAGEHFWDTADIYGDSEELLNKWFTANPDKRKDIFLATKFGNVMRPDGTAYVRGDPAYVKEACDRSLQRLGVDQIDLYYCHRLDTSVPIEQTVRAMVDLKQEGKIKYLGLSECSADSLRRAYKVHPITAVQVEYSPFFLDIEDSEINLLSTCRELGLTLAWLLAQGDDIFPIPGTTSVARLQENLQSLDIVVDNASNAAIRQAAEEAELPGERYPAFMLANLFADTPALDEEI
ncbi:aldo-keto reductase [Talaromyces pinophilus]|uniref:Aldo-keto reductase n=1 Tax=Talaromyces pinophilus TaxID=128442 RepID=A0A6V8H9P3_TALPI|nr:aldo-keto reductase [Talaromyces pinophilus]